MIPFFENNQTDFFVNQRICFSFPLHLHTQLEIAAVLHGTMQVDLGYDTQLLSPGDVAIFFPNTPHGYGTEGKGMFQMILCGLSHTGEFQHTLTRSHPTSPILQSVQLHADVPVALHALAMEPTGSTASSLWLQLLLCRLLPSLKLTPNGDAASSDLTHQVLAYLSRHYREPLCLDQLAKDISVGKYQLSRLFSTKLHISFREYVNQLRIRDAQRALLCTDAPVTQICYDCGFESQRTFNRVFLAQYGVSPRVYRASFSKEGLK